MKITDNTEKIKDDILNKLKEVIEEINVEEIANIQVNTPVMTGTLKRSITGEVESNKDKTTLTLGADGTLVNNRNGAKVKDYAMKVEYEDKSYLRNTLNNDKTRIIEKIEKKISEV